MENSSSKNILLSVIGVLILIVAVIGISYAVWTNAILGTKDNSVKTGYVAFSYTENSDNGIYIEDAIPISDASGKVLSGDKNTFDFTISSTYSGNNNLSYEIYTNPSSNNTLEEKYIKVYLTDENDNALIGYQSDIIPTYDSLNNSSLNTGKLLYSSTIKSNETKKYRLRIWISSDYNLPTSSKEFSFKVNVKGTM